MGILRTQARRLLGVPFVMDGVSVLRDPTPRAQQLAPLIRNLALRYPSVPNAPEALARLHGIIGVLGGALLCFGRAPRTACALLAVQSVPTVLTELRTFREGRPDDLGGHRAATAKDLSLLGALVLSATEPKRKRCPRKHRQQTTGMVQHLRAMPQRPRGRRQASPLPVPIPRPRR